MKGRTAAVTHVFMFYVYTSFLQSGIHFASSVIGGVAFPQTVTKRIASDEQQTRQFADRGRAPGRQHALSQRRPPRRPRHLAGHRLSGPCHRHQPAADATVCDDLEEWAGERGVRAFNSRRRTSESWMLIDFVDVVVHVFNTESRSFYDLDSLWGDAQRVEWNEPTAPALQSDSISGKSPLFRGSIRAPSVAFAGRRRARRVTMVRDSIAEVSFILGIESLETRTLFASPHSAAIDPVIEWNNVLIDALRADRTLPGPGIPRAARAMVQAAIFDAVNAIDGSYEPYMPGLPR
jgi:hypothetical protein